MEDGHATVHFPPFTLPIRILGVCAYAPVTFLKSPGSDLNHSWLHGTQRPPSAQYLATAWWPSPALLSKADWLSAVIGASPALQWHPQVGPPSVTNLAVLSQDVLPVTEFHRC